MTDNTQPEALRLAEAITNMICSSETATKTIAAAADELCRLHVENAALRAAHVQNPAEIEHVAGDVSKNGAEVNTSTQQAAPATQQAPQQEAQEPCPTCAALARTVMLDQVSFDRKPDCYGIRQITDDEGVEEWEDIRTSPDVAREEANDMMATGRGEIYEVVPLWTTPQPPTAQAASSAVLKAIREANMQLVRTGDNAFMLVPYKVATAQAADSVPAGEYPAMPEPFIGVQDRPWGGHAEVIRSAIGEDGVVSCYTANQMRAYVDADRAARAPAESVPAQVLDSLLNIVIHHEARATPEEVRSMAAELATYRAARAPAESVGRDAERLAWMADGWTPGHEKLYVQHVLETGGVGDVDDLRTFIDKQMAANGGNK